MRGDVCSGCGRGFGGKGKRAVTVEGEKYDSITQAANALNRSPQVIWYWLKTGLHEARYLEKP